MILRGRPSLAALVLLPLLMPCAVPRAHAQSPTFYVATNGNDSTGDGSNANPWATIEHAVDEVPDTSTILVKPGLYNGRVRLDGGAPGRTFAQGITIRSEVAYQARLRHDETVVICYYGKGITLEGFDIAHSAPVMSGLVVQIQDLRGSSSGCDDGDCVGRITLRNNILHDSLDNDLLKINNGADDVTVEGNLFYNQTGHDEHIDVNSVTDVVIQDNVFFNDFAASGRPNTNATGSYIVIKDSNAGDDDNLGSLRIAVRRNVFLNWEGSTGSNFVLVGEDGQPFFEGDDVDVENNLMLGNAANTMRASVGVKGARDVTFRHNTVVGNLPSLAYAMRLNVEGSNPENLNIRFFGNVWSDATGTMDDFSDTPPQDTDSFTLDGNLYWNGPNPLPSDPGELVNVGDDASGLIADPLLPGHAGLVTPSWNAGAATFADGSKTIREVFERLVSLYGVPAEGSAALDAADPLQAPTTDILGTPRMLAGASPDLGAFESGPGYALRFYGHAPNDIGQDIDRVRIRVDNPADSVPGPPADVGAGDFALEFWLKGQPADNPQPPVSCGANEAWTQGNIVIDRDRFNQPRKFGVSIAGGRVVFGVTSGSSAHTVCGGVTVLDGAWHHVAVQRRRSDGRLWLFVDGQLEAEEDGPDGDVSYPDNGVPGNVCPPGSSPCTNSDPFLVVGAEKHTLGPSFSGTVDELRLSSTLRYLADFERPGAPFRADAATLALYHFDEGAGNVVADRAGALGGPSPGERRFGGSPPAGPDWVISDAPLGGGMGQIVTVEWSSGTGAVGEGAGSATLTAVLTTSDGEATGAPVTVQYSTADGGAQAGSDYQAASGTLSFAAGSGSGATDSLALTILDDALDEAGETLTATLANPVGAVLGGLRTHTLTITDDDPLPLLAIGDVSLVEGNSGTRNATFDVTLTPTSGRSVSVSYATSDGTAAAPADYATRSGVLTFAAGVTLRTVSVPVVGENVSELDETFFVNLASPQNATLGDGQGEATILNDDAPTTLEFSAAAYKVAEKGPAATIQVRASGGMGGGVVSYRTADAGATAGADYGATSGILSFAPGVTTRTLSVPILKDTLIEGGEGLLLILEDAGGGAVLGPQSTAVLTITDDDQPGSLRFSAASYSRSESLPSAAITVTRTGGVGGPVAVSYATSDGTATAGSDYVAQSGTLTFLAGETKKTLSIALLADGDDEDGETVGLALSSPTNGATLGTPSSATLTIVDDDKAGTVQFDLAAYSTAESATLVELTLTRSGGSAGPVTVDFATADGSAQAGSDYQAASGTVTFAVGATSESFTLALLSDATVEGPETVNVALLDPTGRLALGPRQTAVLTIADDEPAVTLHFAAPSFSVTEGGQATLTVLRSGSTANALTVQYQTSDGDAQAGSDYAATSGTLSFGVGVSAQTFKVPTSADTLDEADEALGLGLLNPTGGAVLGTQASAALTILDNDSGGVLRFSSAAVSRSEGFATATITVTRTGGLASGVGVSYATADGTAQAGVDYTAASGTLSFAAGQKSRTFVVPILADALDEPNETVNLEIVSPSGGATLGSPAAAVLTIADDDNDGALQFSASSYAAGESSGAAQITVTRNGAAGPVTVDYQTSDGSAQAGVDYTAASGTLSFAPGVSSQTFAVALTGDADAEGSETLGLVLLNPSGQATLGARSTAQVTIVDDEPGATLHFGLPQYSTGEGKPASVTVLRSGSAAGAVTVQYQTSDGTATTADSDYTAGSGTLSFKAGQTTLKFTVATTADTRDEADETVSLTLFNPGGGATLGTQASAVLTLLDNDAGGTLQFGAAAYSRGEGLPTATLTVTRTGGAASAVSVHYASLAEAGPGKATAGVDYTPVSGDLTFAAGQKSRTFTVALLPDSLDESDESLTLELSAPGGGAALGSPATTTLEIVDDDTAGTVQFGEPAFGAGEASGTATITVTRVGGGAGAVTVNYATSDGTATAGADYQTASGTLTFGAGDSSRTFTVTILADGSPEANETVTLTLSGPGGGGTLGVPSVVTLYLVDDD